MSLKVMVRKMDQRKSIWEVDNDNMEERINARRERIRKRIGRKHFPVLYREEGFAERNFFLF
jgi:aspartate/tyrosine/aromatic aminotransferase